MYQLVVLYNQPEDHEVFDKHYSEVHSPLASGLPGLQRFTVNRPSPDPGGSKPAYYLIAVLEFEDAGAFGAAVESDRGKATIADFDNFAQAGVTLLPGLAVSVAAGA